MSYCTILQEINEALDRYYELKHDESAYKATLKEQCELADKLYTLLAEKTGTPESQLWERVLEDTGGLASDWLLDLPIDLGRFGMVGEAFRISRRFAEFHEAENFLGDLAVILAEGGMRDEALKQIDDNLARFPNDDWVFIKAGDAFEALNEGARAIELLCQVYARTEPFSYEYDGVLERLVPLLRKQQRDKEADEIVNKDRERRKPVMPAPTPKVGRNDPCLCGSGKKYKKCCLGKSA